jgi:hypothetical protein
MPEVLRSYKSKRTRQILRADKIRKTPATSESRIFHRHMACSRVNCTFLLFTWPTKIPKEQNIRKCSITFPVISLEPRWRSWLRHSPTSRKVAGSIPDGVIGIFHSHNPSGRTMDLGSTQPLTEMSTKNISWRVKATGAYG